MLSSSLVSAFSCSVASSFETRAPRAPQDEVLDPHGEERQRRVSNREGTDTVKIPPKRKYALTRCKPFMPDAPRDKASLRWTRKAQPPCGKSAADAPRPDRPRSGTGAPRP